MSIGGVEVRPRFWLAVSAGREGGNGDAAETALCNAEAALRRAKRGGDTCRVHPTITASWGWRPRQLQARLREALANGDLTLHYQPRVSLGTRALVSVETSIQWRDQDRACRLKPPTVSLAVAPVQLQEPDFIAKLVAALAARPSRQA